MEIQSLAELALDKIKEWIATEELKPGQQLKEEEVAQRLSISRPPVREAFKLLEASGLVERRPRRGVFITTTTQKDLWEIYTLKAVLYEMAAGLAVSVISDREIEQLERMARKMENLVLREKPNILKYQKVHREYHVLILDIANNSRLKSFATILHEQVRRFSYRTLQDLDHLHASLAYHQQIVQAFKDRNEGDVRVLTRKHVLEAMQVLIDSPAKKTSEGYDLLRLMPLMGSEIPAEVEA